MTAFKIEKYSKTREGCGETKSICASHEKRQFEIVAKPRGKAIKA